jgi:hypothetical protein
MPRRVAERVQRDLLRRGDRAGSDGRGCVAKRAAAEKPRARGVRQGSQCWNARARRVRSPFDRRIVAFSWVSTGSPSKIPVKCLLWHWFRAIIACFSSPEPRFSRI